MFATYLLWLAMVFDFFDGFAARMLKVSSPIGKELDSLADMVTFGVLPAVIMFKLLQVYTASPYIPYIAFIIAIFSALRLAKFNIDERQQSVFIGVPTPANALFISSFAFITQSEYSSIIGLTFLLTISILFSFLLVAPVELFALKFKSFGWKGNQIRFTFLVVSVLFIIVFKVLAIPLIILTYIALSILHNVIRKRPAQ